MSNTNNYNEINKHVTFIHSHTLTFINLLGTAAWRDFYYPRLNPTPTMIGIEHFWFWECIPRGQPVWVRIGAPILKQTLYATYMGRCLVPRIIKKYIQKGIRHRPGKKWKNYYLLNLIIHPPTYVTPLGNPQSTPLTSLLQIREGGFFPFHELTIRGGTRCAT